MKKTISTIAFTLFAYLGYSQDMISLKNGETIKANVKEVSDSEVVFSYDKETVINKLPTHQISQIKFKSGRVQKFNISAPVTSSNTSTGNPFADAYMAQQQAFGGGHQLGTLEQNIPYNIDIPEPGYVGTIVLVDENGNVLNTLEVGKAAMRSNANAGMFIAGIGNVKTRNYVKGKSSPVRVNKGKILLVARVMSSQINPNEIFDVFKLNQGRKDRSVIVAESHTFAGTKNSDIDFIPFKAYPYKNNSFLLELNINEPGEYAITLDSSRMMFNLFGVD
ncbi:MAG: hypothetical protein Q3983_04340 [Capnocytophaga sp.]|nr:hypothetical protein [Capnocytophaga sp.]